jgi:organic hydroperoxide reductase OsmC/OhrA
MLTFLYLAAKAGFVVDAYEDDAVGTMAKNERGKLFVSRITLRPAIAFGGDKRPTAEELDALHHQAHEECYIANSILSEIAVEPAHPQT